MLEKKIFDDYKEAMKSKDTLRSSVLSFLRAEMINVAMAKKKAGLDDGECLSVIRKQVKARQDSIEQFTKGNRQDLAQKEANELEVLKSYLPQEISEEEIKKMLEEIILAVGAQGIKDMGKVMKELNAKVAGRADGKTLSELVRNRLAVLLLPFFIFLTYGCETVSSFQSGDVNMKDVANIIHTGSGNGSKEKAPRGVSVTSAFQEKMRDTDDWLQRNLW